MHILVFTYYLYNDYRPRYTRLLFSLPRRIGDSEMYRE